MYFADACSYFQPVERIDPSMLSFGSLKGRLICLGLFIEKLFILPFALFCKSYKTFFRFLAAGIGAALLLLSAGISVQAREFFMRRCTTLSKDLADWVLFPIAAATCFVRLLLSCTVHPALYLKG